MTRIGVLMMVVFAQLYGMGMAEEAGGGVDMKIITYPDRENFVSFENAKHPGNRIGYRIHEHLPLVAGDVPEDSTPDDNSERAIAQFKERAGLVTFERKVTEEGWLPQTWTYYVAPADDGFDMLWVVETQDAGLSEFYAAQQCFRMGGKTNAEWRRIIAETPAFSEYDLWAAEKEAGKDFTSLSYLRREQAWAPWPAVEMRQVARTPLGIRLEHAMGGAAGNVLELLDPIHPASYIASADNGLVTRTNIDGTWVCGLFWEGTAHVAAHHPADCLHTIVNLGPVPPNSRRAVRGKIYWFQGTREYLLSHWKKDFGK